MKTNDKSKRPATPRISSRINVVGGRLANSFRSLLDSIPGQPSAAREMAQVLSIDKILVHKLLSALRNKDPLATAHSIPGPEPLMRVVEAARAKGAPLENVQAAEGAVSSFRDLIKRHTGDRGGLDAIISTLLPDARARFETVAKQSVYRGMRQLKGLASDVIFVTFIIHAPTEGNRLHFASLRGFLGLRCVRPGASMKVAVVSSVANMDAPLMTLDGVAVKDPRDLLLQQFCSGPSANFELHEQETAQTFLLGWGESVGPPSACNIVVGEQRHNAMRRWRSPDDERKRAGVNDSISIPTQAYVFDLLLDQTSYPDWQPHARVMELGEYGLADPNDELRDLDVLDIDVRVQSLGVGTERFRAKEIPNYMELLDHTCQKIGVDPSRLRGYRTRIEYPVFGTHVQFAFDVPVNPSSSEDSANADGQL